MQDTWLSTLMPEILAKYLRKEVSEIQMYHAVPSKLASSKKRAEVFQKYWNLHVSPSVLTYVRSKDGKQYFNQFAKEDLFQNGTSPERSIHLINRHTKHT